MAADLTTPEGRLAEERKVSILIVNRRFLDAARELEFLINATPSGELRNHLTTVNIHLMAAQATMTKVKE